MAFWTLPVIFNTLAAGNEPAALLDQAFSSLAVQPQFLTGVTAPPNMLGTAPLTFAAYQAGQAFAWVQPTTNPGAVTLQVNGIGAAQAVTKNGTAALTGGELRAGAAYTAIHDGTRFQLTTLTGPPAAFTAFQVYATGGPQGIISGVATTITFTTKLFDVGTNIAVGVAGVFTAPVAGIYYLTTTITINQAGVLAVPIPDYVITINTSVGGVTTRNSAAIGAQPGLSVGGLFNFAAGNTANVIISQNSGASLQTVPTQDGVFFGGFRVT